MRTIKFRAWDNDLKGWVAEWVNFAEGQAFVLRGNQMVKIPNASVTQFTGLLDKNGKEIYEGDEIQWNTGKYRRTVEMKDGCWKVGSTVLAHLKNVEIIGNIYQNPELIK